MKIYIVEISKGQWSDAQTTVVSAFSNKEAAETEIKIIDSYYRETRKLEAPYPERDYMEDGKLTKEQEQEYRDWQTRSWDAQEYNSAYIIELELDQNDVSFKLRSEQNVQGSDTTEDHSSNADGK